MRVSLKVTARLQNPPDVWEDTIHAESPDSRLADFAADRLLADILANGGLMRKQPGKVSFIPFMGGRIVDLDIETGTMLIADGPLPRTGKVT